MRPKILFGCGAQEIKLRCAYWLRQEVHLIPSVQSPREVNERRSVRNVTHARQSLHCQRHSAASGFFEALPGPPCSTGMDLLPRIWSKPFYKLLYISSNSFVNELCSLAICEENNQIQTSSLGDFLPHWYPLQPLKQDLAVSFSDPIPFNVVSLSYVGLRDYGQRWLSIWKCGISEQMESINLILIPAGDQGINFSVYIAL